MLVTRSWSALLAWLFIAALAALLLGCSSSPEGTPPRPETPRGASRGGDLPATPAGSAARSSPSSLARLGVIGAPSPTEPRGLRVTGFVAASEPWPIQRLGVEEEDVIVSCNGQQEQIGSRLLAAFEGLESRGEPMVIEVVRDGERIKLEAKEKLTGPDSPPGAE